MTSNMITTRGLRMRRIGLAIVALVFIPSDPHLTTSAGPVVSAFQLNPITQHNTQNVQSQNFHYKNISTARKATPSPNAGLNQGGSLADLPNIRAAVIVPGFLTGKSEFEPLAASLTAKGIPTVVVPMGNWHWLPCLGGRSMRPMLDRIDFTVRHLAAVAGNLGDFETVSQEGLDKSVEDAVSAQAIGGLMPSLTKETMASIKEDPRKVTKQTNPQFLIPNFSYNAFDCWQDFRNNPGGVLKVGGSAEVEEYPLWTPKGSFPEAPEPMGKVALIGHSAGGWICRAYLSQRNYGGKSYCGQELVHSLVTLGSPHGNAPGPAFRGVEWVNRENLTSNGMRALAVAGSGYKGDSSGQLTQNAYAFCCPVGTDGSQYDGDGVTPVMSALAMKESMPGTDTLVLDDVGHFCWSDVFGGETVAPELTQFHREGRPWYGDEDIIEKWAEWL